MLLYLAVGSLVLVVLLSLPVETDVHYQRNQGNDSLKVRIAFFRGLVGLNLKIPVAKFKAICSKPILKFIGEVQTASGKSILTSDAKVDFSEVDYSQIYVGFKQLAGYMARYPSTLRYFMQGIRIKQLTWQTEFGLGDAAVTGVMAGMVWSAKGLIVRYLAKTAKLVCHDPQVLVTPRFDRSSFGVNLDCIIDFRIGHIMSTGISFIFAKFWPQRG